MMILVKYKQLRKEFFERQLAQAQRKLNWWANANRLKNKNHDQIEDMCDEYGMQVSFYEDALDAFGWKESEPE